MIVMAGNPENRALFSHDEIADVDGDGLLSFVDGWESRSPSCVGPGFHALVRHPDQRRRGRRLHHDPFDPRKVDRGDTSCSRSYTRA